MLCLCEAMHVCLMDAFLPRFVIPAKEARPGVVAGRMHMRSKCRRTAQSPAIRVKGSLPGGPRHDVHRFVVNRSAPELFPVTDLINKQFIPAAITSRRACFAAGSKSDRPLKSKHFP